MSVCWDVGHVVLSSSMSNTPPPKYYYVVRTWSMIVGLLRGQGWVGRKQRLIFAKPSCVWAARGSLHRTHRRTGPKACKRRVCVCCARFVQVSFCAQPHHQGTYLARYLCVCVHGARVCAHPQGGQTDRHNRDAAQSGTRRLSGAALLLPPRPNRCPAIISSSQCPAHWPLP
jgi:hypothetical protein